MQRFVRSERAAVRRPWGERASERQRGQCKSRRQGGRPREEDACFFRECSGPRPRDTANLLPNATKVLENCRTRPPPTQIPRSPPPDTRDLPGIYPGGVWGPPSRLCGADLACGRSWTSAEQAMPIWILASAQRAHHVPLRCTSITQRDNHLLPVPSQPRVPSNPHTVRPAQTARTNPPTPIRVCPPRAQRSLFRDRRCAHPTLP